MLGPVKFIFRVIVHVVGSRALIHTKSSDIRGQPQLSQWELTETIQMTPSLLHMDLQRPADDPEGDDEIRLIGFFVMYCLCLAWCMDCWGCLDCTCKPTIVQRYLRFSKRNYSVQCEKRVMRIL